MASNNTLLDTDLSIFPFFDDFVPEVSDYYRILFKPASAVQVRELNQIQSMLQDQISKFGRNVYKEGSIVQGCIFSFDNKANYVKINDAYTNSTLFVISDFENQFVYNSNGLKAQIIDSTAGSLSNAPNTNTLYVKYLNTAAFPNSSPQNTFSANDILTVADSSNVTIGQIQVASNSTNANVGDPANLAYSMSVSTGVVFKKGLFLYVANQSIIVDAYSNQPDGVSVGFNALESIDTVTSNSSLYDNSNGSTNFAAPGADRLKVVPQLVVRNTADIANNDSFFSLVDFKGGAILTAKQVEDFSTLGIEFARRTYETNGDFVISPFLLTTSPIANTSNTLHTTYNQLEVSKGIGYVNGYRVEFLNQDTTAIRKANDYDVISNEIITANFGYYIPVKELCGEFLSSSSIIKVELHNVAKSAISSGGRLGVSYSSTTKIGTAYIRGKVLSTPGITPDLDQYNLFIFNVQMSPGQNFCHVKSIINYSSGILGVADVLLTYNFSSNSNIARIKETYNNGMIFPFGQRAIKSDGFNNIEFNYRQKNSGTFLTTGNSSIVLSAAVGTGTETFPYSGLLSQSQELDFIVVPTQQGLSANLTANVSVNTTSNAVIGSGTSFLSSYVIGDHIGVYTTGTPEIRYITSIANNTYMTVQSAWTNANTNTRHALAFPIGVPIPFFNHAARSMTETGGTTLALSLGATISSAFNYDIFYSVNRSATVPIKKNFNNTVYVKIDCSNNSANNIGPWSLGLPDVYKLKSVWVGTAGSYSNNGTNLVNQFKIDNGQRDTHYDLSTLSLNSVSMLTPNSTILVELQTFTLDTSAGLGFFTCNSYPIDDANTANNFAILTQNIPLYTTSKGTVFDLRDCVDFRPVASNTASTSNTVGGATINPSSTLTFPSNPYLPIPDSEFQTDLQYYLARVDKASLDTGGNLILTEGIPLAINPSAPKDLAGTMTLGIINVPPYPSLATSDAKASNRYDYAITTQILQNRRYTMKDIGALDQRITNLEYYTSLSLLEQSAANLLIRNNDTGQNRFRNGIFVDHFRGFDISNTKDPNFNIAIDSDRSEIRPAFSQKRSSLIFDTDNSTGCGVFGQLIMLNHTSNNLYISQGYASKFRNCIEGNVFEWNGSITLDPPGTLNPDLTQSPDVINNIDLAQNWINLGQSAFGTSWGNWVDVGAPQVVDQQTSSSSTSSTNPDGSTNVSTTTQVVTTTQQLQSQIGQQLDVQTQNNQYNLGTYVTNISILPFLKPAMIRFTAHGLKPNTTVYPFFSNVPVGDYTRPTDSSFGPNAYPTWTRSATYGDILTTDDAGSLYGIFYIPSDTFKAQENTFLLTDVSDLTQGADAITTTASAVFYGSTLSFSTASSILDTRSAVVSVDEVQQNRVLTGSNTSYSVSVSTTAAPASTPTPREATDQSSINWPIPPIEQYYYSGGDSGGGCGCGGY